MDHPIFNKLKFLDDHPPSQTLAFITDLTIPKSKGIDRLVRLKKLHYIVISIYGRDLKTFIAITRSTEKVYRRLIANLEAMLAVTDRKKFDLGLFTPAKVIARRE